MAVLGGVLGLAAAPAEAASWPAPRTPTAQVFACGSFTLDLNGAAAGTDLVFTLPASATSRPLGVLFNAECSVRGGRWVTWLDLNIQLLNAAAP